MADETPWSRLKSELYSLVGRNPKSNRRVVKFADLDGHHAVLDIGCGPGAAVRNAAPHVTRAVGVDRSEAMIDIARRRSDGIDNVELMVGGAELLPFPDASFDRVWTIHAFHHWDEQDKGMAEALRVLRPDGRFMVVESETNGTHGLSRDGAKELVKRLEAIGFASGEISKHGGQLVVTGTAAGT
ncbi:MAG: class I SAM-dependent methyltransferase [Acidimicrobiia bacterium]|nr:class I SAM-dependent methyltransferase [Acidimicrobiia bacterium]